MKFLKYSHDDDFQTAGGSQEGDILTPLSQLDTGTDLGERFVTINTAI